MSISSAVFKIKDQDKECFKLEISGTLKSPDAILLREEVTKCLEDKYNIIYIDAKDVNETDLSGINEIIHSHYTLNNANKQLVFVYKKNSSIEKWVETTGLDKFVAIATVPAD
jgi:anti-anti-sigma factor